MSDDKDIAFWVLGYKKNSLEGSNFRRLWSRVAIFLSLFLVMATITNTIVGTERPTGFFPLILLVAFFIFSFGYFYDVVLRTPFRSSEEFKINPKRLFLDTLVSSGLLIAVYATLYWYAGFGKNGIYCRETPLDAMYFSAVTFSTLGYGDLAPSNASKLFAASQALVGNIHLGFLVGSAFSAIQNQISERERSEKEKSCDAQKNGAQGNED